MAKEIDLTGRIHGEFTVVKKSDEVFVGANGTKHAIWECRCNTCGAVELIQARYIRNNQHKYCQACFENTPEQKQALESLTEYINEVRAQMGKPPKTLEEIREFTHQYCHATYRHQSVSPVLEAVMS